ncbi:hypothetical protein ACRAJ3_11580 [Rhodococcus pyridinivorans]|uniref:hypothetical protein n=1 Tax=Rhodococcus pyridinivorans TaxID=103816 RepID=UPI003D7FB7C5
MTDERLKALAKMREPFADHQINVLPKPYSKDAPKEFCRICNSRHGMPAAHLDYVGHAALTDRLLEVDPEWSWEPFALDDSGLPLFDRNGGLWIRLTVCGVTRLGYGDMGGKNGANAVKEAIGDALRNAGMRFGAALDLWHKGDLHDAQESNEREPEPAAPPPPTVDVEALLEQMAGAEDLGALRKLWDGNRGALGERHDEVAAFVRARRTQLEQPEQQTLDA